MSSSLLFQTSMILRSLQAEERTSGTTGEKLSVKDGQGKVEEFWLKIIHRVYVRLCNYKVTKPILSRRSRIFNNGLFQPLVRAAADRLVCARTAIATSSSEVFHTGSRYFYTSSSFFGAVISPFLLDPSLQWSNHTGVCD